MPEGDRPHSGRRRTGLHLLPPALVVLLLVLAATAHWLELGERWGISADPQEDPAAVAPPSGLVLPDAGSAAPVADPLRARPLDPAAVRQAVGRLADATRLGRRVALVVASASGEPVLSAGPAVVTPASTLKIMTSLAALETLGPEHRFTTSTTLAGDRLTLVGGGDPLLTRSPDPDDYPDEADLTTLARRTAAALERDQVTRVRLGYDATLFAGPAENPFWEPDYLPDDVVSPITALWVDEGRVRDGEAERSGDPARDAAAAFAAALREQGIAVRGRLRPGPEPAAAQQVAAVRSAELVEIVQHVLETSDNEAAEVLARHVAIAQGQPGSFAAATEAVTSVLSSLGVDMRGAVLRDGSGLSRDNRLPVAALVDALALAVGPEHPELSGAAAGLPVAGFTGSLTFRFAALDGTADAGLGRARVKTGTLTGVHGYAGVVVGRDGAPMLFVMVADRVRVPQTLFARDRLDRVAAALAGCACAAG